MRREYSVSPAGVTETPAEDSALWKKTVKREPDRGSAFAGPSGSQ